MQLVTSHARSGSRFLRACAGAAFAGLLAALPLLLTTFWHAPPDWLPLLAVALGPAWELGWYGMAWGETGAVLGALAIGIALANALVYLPIGAAFAVTATLHVWLRRGVRTAAALATLGAAHLFFTWLP